MNTELEMLKNELEQEMFINLSLKNENYESPQAAREAVPQNLRKKGLLITYSCNNRLLIDRFTGYLAVYSNPGYWEAVLGTQDNGMITDLNYVPKSWELRNGSYFTSELVGFFTNFIDIHRQTLRSDCSGLKKIGVEIYPDGALNYRLTVNEYTGKEFDWAEVNRGAIEHLRTYTENGENFAEVFVYPNTKCMGVANRMTIYNGGSASNIHDRPINPGTFKLGIGKFNLFTLVVDRSGNLYAFGSEESVDSILPPSTLKKDCLLIGFFGADPNHPIAPYSAEHVINNDFVRYIPSINMSQRTFADITPYLWGLTFRGEALLNEKFVAVDNIKKENDPKTGKMVETIIEKDLDLEEALPENIYYLTYFENPGTYTYDHIPLTVTTTKPKTVLAICYKRNETDRNRLEWNTVEVPISKMTNEQVLKFDEYVLDEGVYVVIDHVGRMTDLTGRTEKVKVIFLGQRFAYPLVNVRNIDFYNMYFHDLDGKQSYTIENCKFSGHRAYYDDGHYFLNTSFYYNHRLLDVVIRNCVFNLPEVFAVIWGHKLNTIEITGCEFNMKKGKIYFPICINDCATGAVIRNNKVNNGIVGIFFGSNREKPISNCLIENNVLFNQLEESIAFDGFGNNEQLCPTICNGKIREASNDAEGRLVIKSEMKYIIRRTTNPEGVTTNESSIYNVSDLSNWTDYYATFNKGTGIDGTLCRIYSFDAQKDTLTLDCFMDASKINTGEGTTFGVQSGFFDCVVRNNIIQSDIFYPEAAGPGKQKCNTALSIHLNVFNMLVENNKVYRMRSFMYVSGGRMLTSYETLAWGNRVLNNVFMNCTTGGFLSYYDLNLLQYNNVFRGNILKNIDNIIIESQRNFDYRDNIFDNVESSTILNCEGYIPKESELKVHHLGQVYNKFINNNDSDKSLYNIEQKVVTRDILNQLIFKTIS